MIVVALLAFLPGVFDTYAQEQEAKLIDRLLKPNTSLKNSAQDKRFVATSAVSVDQRVSAPNFHFREKSLSKTYRGERAFTPREFAARHFRAGDSVADLSSRSRLTKTDTIISAPVAPNPRIASESETTSPVREFAGSRPFLVRGKSEKAFQAQNRPLTIEQVREVLNKSK